MHLLSSVSRCLAHIFSYNNLITVRRVNWIRAKERRDRWKEELSVTQHEMVWVLLWLQHRSRMWTKHAEAADAQLAPYAHRQAANWKRVQEVSHTMFMHANPDLADVFGYNEVCD